MHHCLLFEKMTLGINVSDLQPASLLHKSYSWKLLCCTCVWLNNSGRYCSHGKLTGGRRKRCMALLVICTNWVNMPNFLAMDTLLKTKKKRVQCGICKFFQDCRVASMHLCTWFTSSGKDEELVRSYISLLSRGGESLPLWDALYTEWSPWKHSVVITKRPVCSGAQTPWP